MGKTKDITICVGIPSSGKSTWSKEQVKYKLDKTVRLCRDDYRMMLKQAAVLDHKGETLVTDLVRKAVVSSINMGYDVIIDATNVNRKYLEDDILFYQKYGNVKFRVFDISLSKAKERDATREATVGEKVIKKMWDQYRSLIDSGFDLYSTRPKLERIENTMVIKDYDMEKEDAVIFDLDGTLAHNNGKRGYFDWTKVEIDDHDEIIREILYSFELNDYKILIVSGRDGASLEPTERWLIKNAIEYDGIFLRPEGDYRKDTVVKTEIYEQYIKPKYNVLCVFEDRKKVVDMWRGLGIKCLQVIDGDY